MSERKGLHPHSHHARRWSNGRVKHPDVWWYDEPRGIGLCVGTNVGCIQALIPISQLRAYIKRHNEAMAKS